MHLLYANCVPILTYASGIKQYPAREMTNCTTALNNAIRKIFSYNRWEVIKIFRGMVTSQHGGIFLTEIVF